MTKAFEKEIQSLKSLNQNAELLKEQSLANTVQTKDKNRFHAEWTFATGLLYAISILTTMGKSQIFGQMSANSSIDVLNL